MTELTEHKGTLADGTAWYIAAPTTTMRPQSGTLVLEPDIRPGPFQRAFTELIVDRGGVLVSVSRDAHAWDYPRTFANLDAVLTHATQLHGTPDNVLMFGASLGGLMTRLTVEQLPLPIAAGVAMDGGGVGAVGLFNTGLDMLHIIASLTDDPGLIRAEPDALAAVIDRLLSTAAGRAWLSVAAAIGVKPDWTDAATPQPAADDLAARQRGQLHGLRLDVVNAVPLRALVERAAGGPVSSNVGYDYATAVRDSGRRNDLERHFHDAGIDLDDALERVNQAARTSADPHAVDWLTRHGQVTGKLQVPLLTVKGLGDPFSVAGEDDAFRDLVHGHDRTGDLLQLHTSYPGHVRFSLAEVAAALDVVEDRLNRGSWDPALTPDVLNNRCIEMAGRDRNRQWTLRPGEPTQYQPVSSYLPRPPLSYPRHAQGMLLG